MSDVEILRAAEAIIRSAYAGKLANVSGPHTQHEAEVFRDTITGLVWARADLMIAQHRTYLETLLII